MTPDQVTIKQILDHYNAKKAQWIEFFGVFDEKAFHIWFTNQVPVK